MCTRPDCCSYLVNAISGERRKAPEFLGAYHTSPPSPDIALTKYEQQSGRVHIQPADDIVVFQIPLGFVSGPERKRAPVLVPGLVDVLEIDNPSAAQGEPEHRAPRLQRIERCGFFFGPEDLGPVLFKVERRMTVPAQSIDPDGHERFRAPCFSFVPHGFLRQMIPASPPPQAVPCSVYGSACAFSPQDDGAAVTAIRHGLRDIARHCVPMLRQFCL